MVVHYFLKTAVPLNEPTGVTARLDASGEVQTLLTTTAGEFYPILGADTRAGLELGPSLQLFEASDSIGQPRRPFGGLSKWVGSPTWDAFSHSVFFIHGGAILRLVGDEVSLVAGDVEERGEQDGVGPDALFSGPEFLVSDGVGSLYCADERSIRRIILPTCWAAAAPPYPAPSDALAAATGVGSGSGVGVLGRTRCGQLTGSGSSDNMLSSTGSAAEAGTGEAATGAAGAGEGLSATAAQVHVTTLPFAAAHTIYALAYVPPAPVINAAAGAIAAGNAAASPPHTPPATPGPGAGAVGTGAASPVVGSAAAATLGQRHVAAVAAAAATSAAGPGSLLFATSTAVYRVPLDALSPQAPAAAAAAAAAAGAATNAPPGAAHPHPHPHQHHQLPQRHPSSQQQQHQHQHHQRQQPPLEATLVSGREGSRGAVDSPRGGDARFTDLFGLTVDAAGAAYLVDKRPSVAEAGIALLRVAPDGAVTTLARGLARMYARPFVLPNGYLVLSCQSDCQLYVLDLGIQPLPLCAGGAGGGAPGGLAGWVAAGGAGAAAGPPPRSLTADLGVLLEDAQQPGGGGTADLVIRVGERRFHCHRAILSARCDYFKQRLAGDGFADAYAAELELPDADADAFALLLRWLYTGAADVASAQACAVAELADRLLLPELSTAAQAVALTCITPANAVDCLLWAWGCCDEGRGGSFAHLLADLKRWYVRHHEEVRRQAGSSRQKLAAAAPALMEELMDAVVDWERSARWRKA